MNVRVVVPRRPDLGHRDRLWEWCRRWWTDALPDADLVEGHHPAAAGPFNRSAAINAGAAAPGRPWDVLVVADGDVCADVDTVRAALPLAAESGRLVLPYERRMLLSAAWTERVLAGTVAGRWHPGARPDRNRGHVSSIQAVARPLWTATGGFDERFVGWGGEDDAWVAACHALGGRPLRLPGNVWHLWHPPSPHRDHRAPLYVQAAALAGRYVAAHNDADEMRRLLAEPRTPDATVAVCLTTGTRPDALATTLSTFDQMVTGAIGRRVVALDGARRPDVPDGWEVVPVGRRVGYARAVAAARALALESGQPWVWWTEDDFRYDRPAELGKLQEAMLRRPGLVQMALMRQPWYPDEVEAGSVLASRPGAWRRRRGGYLTQRTYWTGNPHLTTRDVLARHPWRPVADAERRHAADLFADPAVECGVWGDGTPWVTHLGDRRAGHGY